MDTLLTALGLLLLSTILTLMVFTPRSWLVAVAHGFGIQALIGAVAAVVQIGMVLDDGARRPVIGKVELAVQGVPFHAAGWTARAAYAATAIGPVGNPSEHIDQFLPIAAIQMTIIAVVIAVRKMRHTDSVDLFVGLVVLALIANAALTVKTPWWG